MRSLLEVREHLGGDRIPCLICGKPFRAVCHHARIAHGISARDYKERFGLPVSRGVATPDARKAWGAAVRKTREAGRITNGQPPGGHAQQPAYASKDMRRIDPEKINHILRLVHEGDTLTEACNRPSLPGWTWMHAQMRRDDSLRARVDAVIEALPFSQQARMKKLGARFAAAVAARAGQTSAAIAIALGVSEEAVRHQVKRNAREQPPEPR
jgi:hypothetical protein